MVSETLVEGATADTTDDLLPDAAEEEVSLDLIDAEDTTSSEDEANPDDSDDATEAEPEVAFPTTPSELREFNAELAEAMEYAGAQKREASLRKELGSQESTKARFAQYRAYVEQNGADPARVDAILQDQKLHSDAASMASLGLQALQFAGQTPDQQERSKEKFATLTGKELEAFGVEVMVDAQAAIRATVEAEYEAKFGAEVTRRLAEEMTAKDIESKPRRAAAPKTPAGNAPGTNSYADPSWVQEQMNKNPGWLQEMSPDGTNTNFARSQPAIKAALEMRQKDD